MVERDECCEAYPFHTWRGGLSAAGLDELEPIEENEAAGCLGELDSWLDSGLAWCGLRACNSKSSLMHGVCPRFCRIVA